MNDQYQKPYISRNLKIEEKKALCYRAKELSNNWWVDKLDCRESFMRQSIEMPFDEIMKKLDSSSLFFIIHRIYSGDYLEIGFRTSGKINEPDYFLWIQTDKEHIPTIVEEFGIKEYTK